MKKLSCKDIDPSTMCDFEATGSTTESVVGKMMKHIESDHADKLNGMTLDDMKRKIEPLVH